MVEDWVMQLPLRDIYHEASRFKISAYLIAAMVSVESSGRSYACRYEPHYQWLHDPEKHAKLLNITVDTERTLQKMSFGPMQIMGSTARYLGYSQDLLKLTDTKTGLFWGCKFLYELIKKHESILDAISSYNQGSPRKVEGDSVYLNQPYVDKVCEKYKKLSGRSIS